MVACVRHNTEGVIINGTDRTAGKGFAHLIVYDGKGKRIADASITKVGEDEYHNGGIDYDGEFIWGTIAQYRPNSTAYAFKADPKTLEPHKVVHYANHLGGIIHDTYDNSITCLNWGSRQASTWHLSNFNTTSCNNTPRPERVVRNPSHFVELAILTTLLPIILDYTHVMRFTAILIPPVRLDSFYI